MIEIGRRNTLKVAREAKPGLYLDGEELGEILLPRRYIPEGAAPGDSLDVFIYLDSEDRLVATTETPRVMAGEFALLEVIGVHPKVGAFLDWGLAKDLLLPFREQERPVRKGEKVVAAVYVDGKSRRIVASARLERHLSRRPSELAKGQAVTALIYGKSPLGYKAIVNHSHSGLLYHDTVSTPIRVGQSVQAFVRELRPGGKIDLSLDAAGYKRVAPLKELILAALTRNGGRLEMDDQTDPAIIRENFDVSKKAFKQALGALYKERRIRFHQSGIELVEK